MTAVEKFDSTESLFRALGTRDVNAAWAGQYRSSRNDGPDRKRFSGTETWEEALELARNGYAKPVENMKKLTASKTLTAAERVGIKPSKPVNSVVGGAPNVARAIMGVPRDMRRTVFEKRKVPGVELVYDMSIPCRVKAAKIERHGTRFLALGNVLEMSNIPVKLVASIAIDELAKDTVKFDVTIKDYGNVLNIEKAAFYLAHPSFLRRIGLALIETSPIVTMYDGGYGMAITNDADKRARMREEAKEHNARWFTFSDFESDDDILAAYEDIKNL